MNKYKLVPAEPTPEMIHAGQMAVSGFPRDVLERWQAMLAAAPAVEQAPVAWVSPNALSRLSTDSPVNCAVVHKIRINESFPLYLHPQPTPDVSHIVKLLDRARSSVDYQMGAQNQNHEVGRKHYAQFQALLGEIDAAITTYRHQEGSK